MSKNTSIIYMKWPHRNLDMTTVSNRLISLAGESNTINITRRLLNDLLAAAKFSPAMATSCSKLPSRGNLKFFLIQKLKLVESI